MIWCTLPRYPLTAAKAPHDLASYKHTSCPERGGLQWAGAQQEPSDGHVFAQPEKQHGISPHWRTFGDSKCNNLKILEQFGLSIWMYQTLFFDRVHWPSLWRALSQQGISDHMVGLLQTLHKNQTVQIAEANGSSWIFDIKGGVGQGCVLSPRLFYAVLEMAMGMWRGRVGRLGLDLGDGGRTPLDLRSADDILILVTTYIDAVPLLDEFVLCFFVW